MGAYSNEYGISVLQILNAEKTIRVRSLIDSGFEMSDLKGVMLNNDGSTDTYTAENTYLSVMTSDFQFSESLK